MIEERKLFRPLDLLLPIGSCAISIALCVWGAIVSDSWLPRSICIMTAIVFAFGVVAWYWVRFDASRYDFITVHGLRVRLGKQNRPAQVEIEQWTETTLVFWGQHLLSAEVLKRARQMLRNRMVVFCDQPTITSFGRLVYGYATFDTAVVGNVSVRQLFRHELSHWILFEYTGIWSEDEHHRIMKDKGFA